MAAYIDGFNLYYGLRSKKWRRYYWLNLILLVENLLRPNQRLVSARYFTTRVLPEPGDLDKPDRQNVYLAALETLPDLTIHYGYFLKKKKVCHSCGAGLQTYEEKMTDVNIAVSLLTDAQDNIFDIAIVVSADSDLFSPIEEVRKRYPGKGVVVAFPPNRVSKQLRDSGPAFTIGRDTFRDSQFPTQVIGVANETLYRPFEWS